MKRQKNLEGLIALLLFGVFAVCLLIVLLTGADAYHHLTKQDSRAYDSRVLGQYLTAQVRQNDSSESVAVTQFGDGDALSLTSTIEGETYTTLIYSYDGYLMELFCAEPSEMVPEDGEQIMPVSAFSLEKNGASLYISYDGIKETGRNPREAASVTLHLTLRCEKEAAG